MKILGRLEKHVMKLICKRVGNVGDRVLKYNGIEDQVGTSEQWDAWRARAMSQCGRLYWLMEAISELECHVDRFLCLVWYDPKRYLYYRFVRKSHLIECKGLRKGHWNDTKDRVLYGIMSQVVDFFEVRRKEVLDMYNDMWEKVPEGRYCCEGEVEKDTVERYTKKTMESLAGVYASYLWWKNEYPKYRGIINDMWEKVPMEEDAVGTREKMWGEIDTEEAIQNEECKKALSAVIGCWELLYDD